MSTQERLYVSMEKYGLNDERTLKLSQERDKEIEIEQRLIYERYKQCIA